jgi:uncharacterized protein YcbX
MHLSALHIYPVKSCRGLSVTSAEVDDHGFVGDRSFMVVTEAEGLFLTQRSQPRMALIETTLDRDSLILSSPNRGSVTVPRSSPVATRSRRVTVWKSTVNADDCGDEPAEWLTNFLGLPLRLVRIGGTYQRPNLKPAARAGDVVSFADSCPFLMIGEASLADLNDRLVARAEEPLPMNRFRPNLVIAGSAPYAEDSWNHLKAGAVIFRNAGPCTRCPITTTNQETAERRKEPLRTLATYRRDPADPTDVNFGANLIHETKRGTMRVGDAVTLQ